MYPCVIYFKYRRNICIMEAKNKGKELSHLRKKLSKRMKIFLCIKNSVL